MPSATTATDPETAAADARTWLGISAGSQAGWRDDYAAFYAWRAALEERQILVFSLDIGRGDVRGFSAWDDHAPLIVANSSGVNPAARSFTLMHEFGHLLLRQDAACVESVSPLTGAEVERWCERFGAAVLMPLAETQAWAKERSLGNQQGTLDDVKVMMSCFRVSARAAALRLIALNYAPRSLYADVLRVFVPKPRPADQKISSAPRPTLRRRQYGDRVLRTIINSLPARDALSILRLEVEDVRRLADEVPGVQEI
jgi:Zn-dependent peptidase ImmA (M78 family)